jgi:hypothetical protein
MRNALVGLVVGLAALAPHAARAQVVFLQNDSWGGGASGCNQGIGDLESLASKFTAQASQYPYTIDRIRVLACGGGFNPYNVFISQDNGPGPAPGPLIWKSANSYFLTGSNVFNDILMSSEPVPPPPITSGSIRVELFTVFAPDPVGFGTDLNGIVPQRNFILSGEWNFAETLGVTGDWILRLGIVTPSANPALSVLDVVLPEGNSGSSQAIFTVSLSPASAQAVTVEYGTSDGSAAAGADYVAASGTLTFLANETVKTFPVTINGDVIDESDETFAIQLTNPTNAVIDRGEAAGTITDDDAPPSLSVSDVSVTEGHSGAVNAVFNVSLGGLTAHAVSVSYATASETATSGADFTAASGTLTFTPGTSTRTITVTVHGDLADEPNETFLVNLGAPVNATLADGQARGTILDDDGFRYYTVAPCRVLDTRTGPPVAAGAERTINVSGLCGVPSTAKAVAVNLTVNQPTADGFLRLYPAGVTPPITSVVNYVTGQTRANSAILGLGNGGAVIAFVGQASGTTHMLLDVYGYFE